MRKSNNPVEIKKALYEDVLGYFDSSFHCKFSPSEIDSILHSFEAVDYNLYLFFDKKGYSTISSPEAKYEILSWFLEYCPLRSILSN